MEGQLIGEIERRPVLYDRSVQACKKMSARDEAWREVADIMKQTGNYAALSPCSLFGTRTPSFCRGRSEETVENTAGFVHEVPSVAEDVRAQGQEEDVDLLRGNGVPDTAHRAQRVSTKKNGHAQRVTAVRSFLRSQLQANVGRRFRR